MNSTLKTLFLWIAIFVVVILLWNLLNIGPDKPHQLSYTEFIGAVDKHLVATVTVKDKERLEGAFRQGGQYKEGEKFSLDLPFEADSAFTDKLEAAKVVITSEHSRENPLFAIFLTWGPILLLLGLWVFFMRQMQTGGNKALSFGKSKAKLLSASGKKVTFKEVAGIEEAKEELAEIVEFLKELQKF